MVRKGKLPNYPDFTGLEGYTKNKVVTIDKKLFNVPIYWQVKVDGTCVGCYLDDNGELQLRTRESEHIAEDQRQRFLKLPCAENVKRLIVLLQETYPDDYIMLFGEWMPKGKSPKKIEKRDEDSFKAFDLYVGNYKFDPHLIRWEGFSDLCDTYGIPRVDLVEKSIVTTFDEMLAVRERLFTICKENRWEGVVGKVWVTNEFGNFMNIVKEKPTIPVIKSPHDPVDDLPDLPDSEITGAIEKVLVNEGSERFCNVEIAMPLISSKVKEQYIKHGCRKPASGRVFNLYRERVMRL